MSPCNETWTANVAGVLKDIPYHDLDDRHLDNIIRLLERQLASPDSYTEGAIEAKEDELMGLTEERKRRGHGKVSREELMQQERLAAYARIEKRTEEFRRKRQRRG